MVATHIKKIKHSMFCDWCVFKEHNKHDFVFNFAPEWQSSERSLLLFELVLYKHSLECVVKKSSQNSSDQF